MTAFQRNPLAVLFKRSQLPSSSYEPDSSDEDSHEGAEQDDDSGKGLWYCAVHDVATCEHSSSDMISPSGFTDSQSAEGAEAAFTAPVLSLMHPTQIIKLYL